MVVVLTGIVKMVTHPHLSPTCTHMHTHVQRGLFTRCQFQPRSTIPTAGSRLEPADIYSMTQRYLVCLPQDSQDVAQLQAWCDQHSVCFTHETWYLEREYQFNLIYTDNVRLITWIELAWPNTLFKF
jgi:hypothetical protein